MPKIPKIKAVFSVLLALVYSLLYCPVASAAGEAAAVMQAVKDRYRGNSWEITSTITLIDKRNISSHRKIQVRGINENGDEKTLTRVLAPAKLQGTGFLNYDWQAYERENASWLFLPELGKVTRLSGANLADYFLGSDFTYGDLEELEVRDFTYKWLPPADNSTDLSAIVATPVDLDKENKYGYKKIHYWVDADKKLIVRAKYWLKQSAWIKYYRLTDVRQHSGVWLGMKEQMVLTRQNKRRHSSVIQHNRIEINPAINPDIFTVFSLEKGH
ncbi:MAG: outer membrane lipoprotein-sorting protein [Cellvibrionaceae bacterium]|nr:outer membrane lipoprotein-sorting protein [Cellvibrionaceae bacterium]